MATILRLFGIGLVPLGIIGSTVVACAAVVDEEALQAAVESPAGRIKLAQAELHRVAGAALDEMAKTSDGRRFVAELESSAGLTEDLMFSGPLPDDPAKMLRVLLELWKSDRAGFAHAKDRAMAAAVALTFGSSKWPENKAKSRYEYFRDSRRKGLLHPIYDGLEAWEMRYLASAGSNGGWSDVGGWGDDSLVWLRDHVKLPVRDYTGACWQAPYRSDNLFGDSIHGAMYYAPFGDMIHAKRVRDVGGVCGSLSHYGATSARANGIPAITMGEPGHCAYAVRVARGEWTPAYSLSWQRGLHTSLWGGTWTQLVLQDKVMSDREANEKSTAHIWQARGLLEKNPELAESAYRMALETQPLNQPAWLEAMAYLKNKRKPDAESWCIIQRSMLKALAAYPEAAWEVASIIQPAALATLSQEQKFDYLLEFHRAIANQDGPVMWPFENALNAQAAALGGDLKNQLEFFEKVLSLQAGSKSWFAPTIAWGQAKFGTNPATSGEFFKSLAKVFVSDSAVANKEGLRAALRPAVLAAEAIQDVDAFQALGKAGASLRQDTPLKSEPFPGELLSAGGVVKISSTSGWDSPESHWGLLESCGGRFHTESQVRPYVIARLGKLGDLSGIVIHDPSADQNSQRQLPLKVSISEDGQAWTEVFRTDKHEFEWRIPLQGKATRVQFVKVERDDERKEFFHLSAIHAYGRRLQ